MKQDLKFKLGVVTTALGSVVFSLKTISADVVPIPECVNNFSFLNGKQTSIPRYPGGKTSIKKWLSELDPNSIKNFIPGPSRMVLNDTAVSNPALKKLLTKFTSRVNLDHGAMFALSDSLSVLEKDLDKLSSTLNKESLLIQQAFQAILTGKTRPAQLDIPDADKIVHQSVLDRYHIANQKYLFNLQEKVHSHVQSEDNIDRRLLLRAREKGTEVDRAVQYQATVYYQQLQTIQKQTAEVVELFSEIVKNNFITEEIVMANFMPHMTQFEAHLANHDSSRKIFERLLTYLNSPTNIKTQQEHIKATRATLGNWLDDQIRVEDMTDYGKGLASKNPESYFAIKQGATLKNSTVLRQRWDKYQTGFNSIQEFLLHALNSDKVILKDPSVRK